MENKRTIVYKLILGGALLGVFLVLINFDLTSVNKWTQKTQGEDLLGLLRDGNRGSESVTQDINKVTVTPIQGDNQVTQQVSPILSPPSGDGLSPKPTVSPVSTHSTDAQGGTSSEHSLPELGLKAQPNSGQAKSTSSPQASMSPITSPKPPTVKKTGKIVVNEIAWAGTEASATDEWIELYNTENYDVDLGGWALKAEDGSPEIMIEEGKVIKANTYFLLERSNDLTISTLLADQIYTGALSNDGEVLRLVDSSGLIVDVVGQAGEAWPAGSSTGKVSMERIDFDGSARANWKSFNGSPSAKDANGNFINGTPKASNSVVVTAVTGTSSGGGGGSTSPDSTSTSAVSGSAPSSPQGSVPNGSPQVTPTPSLEPESDTSPIPVVINEIAWMGTATSSSDEWMELYNTTGQIVDLTDWTLSAQDGTPNITLSGSIDPFGFYLLERTDDATISDIFADQTYTGALGNNGESLKLRDSLGNLKDSADFSVGWPAGNNITKSSMERVNSRMSGDSSSNWITNNGTTKNGKDAAGNSVNGTSRAKNSVLGS